MILVDMQTFRDRVKEMRLALGLSQEELAERAGMSQQAINKLEERGKSSKYIVELATALNVSPEWLKTGKDTPSQKNIRFPLSSWGNLSSIDSWEEISFKENYIYLKVQDTDMVNGSELSPTFPPGTIIIIDPDKKYKIRDCVIATHKLSGAVLFRRVMKYGIDLILEPLSARGKFYEIEEFYIIGVVVAGLNINLN